MTRKQYLYDLHIHIKPHSVCSHLTFDDVCNYMSNRLSGFAITDHSHIPSAKKIRSRKNIIQDKRKMILIHGAEISTLQGDLLVFGITKLPSKNISIRKTINHVHDLGGVVIAAHPFRGSRSPGGGIGDKVYEHEIDALEVNGHTGRKNNQLAICVAKELNLPTVGGSDAHHVKTLNTTATSLSKPLQCVTDLVKAIRQKKTEGIHL